MLQVEPLTSVNASVLNADNPGALVSVLGSGSSAEPLKTDCDEQLLISMPFPSAVKLHSLIIEAGSDTGPKNVKLFINHDSLGFSDVEDAKPHHEFELTAKDLGGGTVTLPFVKFQFVTNLTIFVTGNQSDDEVTTLSRIQLFGVSKADTNMSEFKKVG